MLTCIPFKRLIRYYGNLDMYVSILNVFNLSTFYAVTFNTVLNHYSLYMPKWF